MNIYPSNFEDGNVEDPENIRSRFYEFMKLHARTVHCSLQKGPKDGDAILTTLIKCSDGYSGSVFEALIKIEVDTLQKLMHVANDYSNETLVQTGKRVENDDAETYSQECLLKSHALCSIFRKLLHAAIAFHKFEG